jgi:hypothetical protein
MSKIEQEKISVNTAPHYKLVRENDGLVKQSDKISWIEWDDTGRFKELHNDIAVGRSCLLGPTSLFFAWETTPVTEILEQSSTHIKFKTLNSVYNLHITK